MAETGGPAGIESQTTQPMGKEKEGWKDTVDKAIRGTLQVLFPATVASINEARSRFKPDPGKDFILFGDAARDIVANTLTVLIATESPPLALALKGADILLAPVLAKAGWRINDRLQSLIKS